MNIVYVSEQNFIGKIPEDMISYRSDLAWMKMLDAFHLPYDKAIPNPNNEFYSVLDTADLIMCVPSKTRPEVLQFPATFKQMGKKVALVQEGPKTYWLNWSVENQFIYLSLLKTVDIVFCHNENDREYYKNFRNKPTIVLSTVMDTELWKKEQVPLTEKIESLFVGGNCGTEWYSGTHSYIVGAQPEITSIGFPSMGRKSDDEERMITSFDKRVVYHPYKDWATFMKTLKSYKYAIHLMPISAAGSFNLNCAVLGIPCIGNKYNDTQRVLFPDLAIDPNDLHAAVTLMRKLIEDTDFYNTVVNKAQKNLEYFDLYKCREEYLSIIQEALNES